MKQTPAMSDRSVRFLLIEDDDDHADLILRAMRSTRSADTVERASDGDEALRVLRREAPFEQSHRPATRRSRQHQIARGVPMEVPALNRPRPMVGEPCFCWIDQLLAGHSRSTAMPVDSLGTADRGESLTELLNRSVVRVRLACTVMLLAVLIEVVLLDRISQWLSIEMPIGLLTIATLLSTFAAFVHPALRSVRQASTLALEHNAEVQRLSAETEAAAHAAQSLRDLLEDHTLFSVADASGTIVDVNSGLCRISGYTREELIGQSYRLFESGYHDEAFWKQMRATLESGKPWRGEICNKAKDGSLFWVDATDIPEISPNGEITGYVTFRLDITRQKAAEQASREARRALAANQEELQAIIDAIPAYIYYKDDNNTILNLNATAAQSIGLPRESIIGRPAEDFFPPEDCAAFLEDDREVLGGGVPKLGIVEGYEAAGGERRRIVTDKIPLRGPSGLHDRLVAVATDITELAEANEALTMAEERLSLAMTSANIGRWDWDITTGDTEFSDTWYTMLGFEPGELPMTVETWKGLVHPDDLAGALSEVERHLKGGTCIYKSECRLRTKSGGWTWVRQVGEIVARNDAGEPTRMVGFHIDIQALREARSRAEAASNAKSDFLANMSHEIRTPMTAIVGYADLLAHDETFASDPARGTEAIRSIQTNARHLLAIINDILDMSKIEAGQLQIEHTDTDPVQIIEEVVSILRPLGKKRGTEIQTSYHGPLPRSFACDPTRLRQILMNLAGNALKFTNGGVVTVAATLDRDGQRLALSVADTGIGMDADQLERIRRFEAFAQGDASVARKYGGSGLGLRISSRLANMLGGTITIDSEPGVGTTARCTIACTDFDPQTLATIDQANDQVLQQPPRLPAAPGQGDATGSPEPTLPLSGMRILLAEDGPDNQRLVTYHLERAGATVQLANNGREAVDAYAQSALDSRPDLILMDMQMPVLDGYAAAGELRSLGHTVPIIALTAHAMSGDRERCLSAGCDGYVAKPIDAGKLIAACAASQPRRRSA